MLGCAITIMQEGSRRKSTQINVIRVGCFSFIRTVCCKLGEGCIFGLSIFVCDSAGIHYLTIPLLQTVGKMYYLENYSDYLLDVVSEFSLFSHIGFTELPRNLYVSVHSSQTSRFAGSLPANEIKRMLFQGCFCIREFTFLRFPYGFRDRISISLTVNYCKWSGLSSV